MNSNDKVDPEATNLALGNGELRGRVRDGIRCFYSVPYAAPLTTERRFRAPLPVEGWTGVRDATKSGPVAPQNPPPAIDDFDTEPLLGAPSPVGPEYLTLNVFAPQSGQDLPVMVFVHGGSFVAGSKDIPLYDGRGLARDGAICVVINYRLGIEGFLPIPGVPTNLGLRDIVAALEWVRDNIVVFGGDPGNVTLFGESGGACCVAALVTSPLARPLFHRAICQSGHGFITRSDAVMQRLVKRLARRLGIPPTRDGFLSVSAERMLVAQEWAMKPSLFFDMRDDAGRDPSFGLTRYLPVHGDDVLPMEPMEAMREGVGKEIDLLIGSTLEEANAFLVPGLAIDKIRRWQALFLIRKAIPRAIEALRAYGLFTRGGRPGEALAKAMTDLMFRWPVRRAAELHQGNAHVFEFDWRSPAVGNRLGAAHAIELPFVFDTLGIASGPRGILGEAPPQRLSDRIRAIWLSFAMSGHVPWPPYSSECRAVCYLENEEVRIEEVMPAAAFLP